MASRLGYWPNLVCAIGVAAMLLACQPGTETPPTPTPPELADSMGATSPDPTNTPTPTKTATPRPTRTARPTITATPTMTPTASQAPLTAIPCLANSAATPAFVSSSNINPLTGLEVADPTVLNRRPLAIKVSNDPAARPQSGLSFADLVYEHYTEGAEVRLTAIFYSQSPERAGSVRSGRLIDLEIVPMYDAIFSASGYSDGMLKRVRQSYWCDRNLSGPFYGRPYLIRIPGDGLAVEHTLFAVPDALWALASEKGVNQRASLMPGMNFDLIAPGGGTPASRFAIDYRRSNYNVDWQYDPATGRYLRWQDDQIHIDALNGQPLAFDNVVVVGAMHVDADFIEDGPHKLLSVEIQIWGEGPLSLFRDGQRYEGRWHRNDPQDMLTFTDMAGHVLPLKPGQSWFEVVPIGFDKLFVEY